LNVQSITRGKRILEASGAGVTCLPLLARLKAYRQFNCIEYMAVRKLLHTKYVCSPENGGGSDRPYKMDNFKSYASTLNSEWSSELSSRSESNAEPLVLHSGESSSQLEVSGTSATHGLHLENPDQDSAVTGMTDTTLMGTSKHLQLERGLRWNQYTPEEEVHVQSLSPHVQENFINMQREHVVLYKLKLINEYIDVVDGKGYGFKFMDLFASKHTTDGQSITQSGTNSVAVAASATTFVSEGLTRAYRAFDSWWPTMTPSSSNPTTPLNTDEVF
jgi:hypothetical protein